MIPRESLSVLRFFAGKQRRHSTVKAQCQPGASPPSVQRRVSPRTAGAIARVMAFAALLPPLSHAAAQDTAVASHPAEHEAGQTAPHQMLQISVGRWHLLGMAQVFPVVTVAAPERDNNDPFRRTEWYLTQPAVMINVESPSRRLVLRSTLNFEGVTLENGEVTLGGWGEGFIDERHPHTLLHELMLSVNAWDTSQGHLSLSVGKGFAPYGTDDPMSRPALKYPTNHHLSQILERWTVRGVWLRGAWGLEAGVFGGTEPTGPYDMSNISSFGDSWSARVTRRWGGRAVGLEAEWEASVSYAAVTETHHEDRETTRLLNAALRHSGRRAAECCMHWPKDPLAILKRTKATSASSAK